MKLDLKKRYIFISLIILVTDLISKALVVKHLPLYDKVDIIKGFFSLVHIRNTGAVWGLFSNASSAWVSKAITVLSILALILVIYFFLKLDKKCTLDLLGISFILGGALGNIINRVRLGYVIDFLDFYIKQWHWATFNVADSFITIGVIVLAVAILLGKCPQMLSEKGRTESEI